MNFCKVNEYELTWGLQKPSPGSGEFLLNVQTQRLLSLRIKCAVTVPKNKSQGCVYSGWVWSLQYVFGTDQKKAVLCFDTLPATLSWCKSCQSNPSTNWDHVFFRSCSTSKWALVPFVVWKQNRPQDHSCELSSRLCRQYVYSTQP